MTRRIYVGRMVYLIYEYIWYISQKFIAHPGPPPPSSSTWTGSTSLLGTWSWRAPSTWNVGQWAYLHLHVGKGQTMLCYVQRELRVHHESKGVKSESKLGRNLWIKHCCCYLHGLVSFSQHNAPKNLNKTSQISLKYVCMTYLLQMLVCM